MECNTCTNKIGSARLAVQCSQCHKHYHCKCVDLTTTDSELINSGNKLFKCYGCGSSSKDGDFTLSDVMKKLNELITKNVDMCVSIELCHTRIQENNKLLKDQDARINSCLERIDSLSQQNTHLQKENAELKRQINEQNQYSRKNSLEIFGVPEIKDENVIRTVQVIAQSLGVNLDKQRIDAAHRLKSNLRKPNEPRGIIIKFISRLDKDDFLKARKVKRDFNTSHLSHYFTQLNVHPAKAIYINESLTYENKQLLNKCREFKKNKNVKYLWSRNGQIFMRMSDNSQVFKISSIESLRDVH
ncbi:hypothetical protein RI129_005947 [Pyrocoelia pectoralis]|uniref:Phorbol-ester/DAG-type domain-containing protein n=1 Tax=Pyrocoelia pectoralis TaxID=417401 RepID=A0AAN7ZJC8_9COLE